MDTQNDVNKSQSFVEWKESYKKECELYCVIPFTWNAGRGKVSGGVGQGLTEMSKGELSRVMIVIYDFSGWFVQVYEVVKIQEMHT